MPATKKIGAPKEKNVTNNSANKEATNPIDIAAANFLEQQRENAYIGFYLKPETENNSDSKHNENIDAALTQEEIKAYKKFVTDEGKKLNEKLKESKRASESLIDDNTVSRKRKIDKIISQQFGITQLDTPQLHNIYYVIIDACDKNKVAELDVIRKQKIFEGNRALAQADRLIVSNAAERVKNIRYSNQEMKKRPSLVARENEIRSLHKEVYKYVSVWVDNELVNDLQATSIGHLYNNLDRKKGDFNQQNLERVQALKEEVAKHLLNLTHRRFLFNFAMEMATQQNDLGSKTQLTLILQKEPSMILRDDIAKSENVVDIQPETPRQPYLARANSNLVPTMFATPRGPRSQQTETDALLKKEQSNGDEKQERACCTIL